MSLAFSPRRAARPWLLLIPALALLAGVLFLPLIMNVVRSVTTPVAGVGNYSALVTDGVTLTVLGRTALTALAVVAVTLLLGYPYAYLMTRTSGKMTALLMAIVLVPFWTSMMARNFAWMVLLQDGGPLQQAFGFLGIDDVVLYGTTAGVVVAMTQVMLPFMVLPLYSALSGIDRRLLLAARGLGSSRVAAFWKIYWPLSRGGVVAGSVLVFTLSAGFYVTPALIGSPQQSLVAQLLGQRTRELLDFGGAGALGTVILIVSLLLVAWANRFGGSVSAIGVATVGTKGK